MTNEHDEIEAEILAKITRRLGSLPRLNRAAFLLRRLDDLNDSLAAQPPHRDHNPAKGSLVWAAA